VLLRAFLRQFEREFQDPVDAMAAHHGLLDHDLALGVGKHPAADARILAFGVFAHDVKVDVAGLAIGQRTLDAGHQPHRAQVHVLVERPAKLQQRPPQRHMVGNLRRPAHGAEVNRVVAGQRVEPVVRQHLAVALVVGVAREIEVIPLEVDAEAPRGGIHDTDALGHHFRSDSVSGNDSDLVLTHGWEGAGGKSAARAEGLLAVPGTRRIMTAFYCKAAAPCRTVPPPCASF
jgi:hypothetical protein